MKSMKKKKRKMKNNIQYAQDNEVSYATKLIIVDNEKRTKKRKMKEQSSHLCSGPTKTAKMRYFSGSNQKTLIASSTDNNSGSFSAV
jgi:hypothetical protein